MLSNESRITCNNPNGITPTASRNASPILERGTPEHDSQEHAGARVHRRVPACTGVFPCSRPCSCCGAGAPRGVHRVYNGYTNDGRLVIHEGVMVVHEGVMVVHEGVMVV